MSRGGVCYSGCWGMCSRSHCGVGKRCSAVWVLIKLIPQRSVWYLPSALTPSTYLGSGSWLLNSVLYDLLTQTGCSVIQSCWIIWRYYSRCYTWYHIYPVNHCGGSWVFVGFHIWRVYLICLQIHPPPCIIFSLNYD